MTSAIHFAKMVLLTYKKSITGSLQIFFTVSNWYPACVSKQSLINFQLINN